jgi:tellurite resistance protein TerB
MPLWDQLKTRASEMNSQLQTKVGQYKNQQFADGAMAICALIAAADGSIDAAERQKTASFIMNNDTLQVFDTAKLKETFDRYCGKLESDFDFGKVDAVSAIGKLRDKPDQARAVIQVGVIIGGADGTFDDDEKSVVREACNAVGIAPAEFDL